MLKKQPKILIFHEQPDDFLDRLRERFPALQIEVCRSTEQIASSMKRLQPEIILSWKSKIVANDAQRQALLHPSVQWVHIGGAGFEHLQPLDQATAVFSNCGGVLADFLAECVSGALLMMNYQLPAYIRQQRQKIWQHQPWTSVAGKTVLIIGLGHIGSRVAAHCKHFGMHVMGIRNSLKPVPNVDELLPHEQLHQALSRADFICLHIPHTTATDKLIDHQAFAQMQQHAILINAARGGVVDETAMIEALQQKQIGGAFLDVFTSEPLAAESPLWDLDNVIISPHIADTVSDWEIRCADFFADNIDRWLSGKGLHNIVNVQRGY